MPVPASAGKRGAATANRLAYIDATGDNTGGSPDITNVVISNDDAGMLEFRLTIANRTDLGEHDFVSLYIDSDQSAASGCDVGGGLGIDWVLVSHGHVAPEADSLLLRRYSGCTLDDSLPKQESLVGTFDSTTSALDLRIDRAELGGTAAFRLLVIASTDPDGPTHWDLAGETTPWVFPVLIAEPRDQTPPRAKALRSSGVHGGVARLRYIVFEESGRAREELTVTRGRRVLARRRTPLGKRDATRVYFRPWRVPENVTGVLRFCVRAWDAEGNRSGRSCARLTIR